MVHFLIRVAFIFQFYNYFGHATRFLPMVVWDHINPQLSCKCNWLVIPHANLYDRLEFVCPTLKIAFKQVDGYSRPEQDMNENIFRRKWIGTKEDLANSIRNGTIHSFCNPSSDDATKIHTCKNGAYDSAAVTFKYDMDKNKHYQAGQIYVFYNNGDDGKEPTLGSKKVHCTMLFAVYVSYNEKVEHDITFGKKAFTSKCDCDDSVTCPSPETVTTQTSTVLTSTSLGQKQTEPLIPRGGSSLKVQPTEDSSSKPMSSSKATTTIPLTNCRSIDPTAEGRETKCEHYWLTTELFIVTIVTAFMFGVLGAIVCLEIRRPRKKKGGFTNPTYHSYLHQTLSSSPEETDSRESQSAV